MRRLGMLALSLLALGLTALSPAPRSAAAAGFCQCESFYRQTTTESAKSPSSCIDAQNKLYNNKLLPQETCPFICVQGLVTYTVPCYYDPADARYHVSGYTQYKCTLNGCDPNPPTN